MTKREHRTKLSAVESLVSEDRDLMKALLRANIKNIKGQTTDSLWPH
ncbi:MAG: hypothetical protein MUE59_09560 [Thiobacillaceae bacterium]|jgi:hypothetical protein|nr:hypothetical protein [Thiobacillaceae bacterium]